MTSSRKSLLSISFIGLAALLTATANAALPPWLQHVPGASAAEAALYRVMHLPVVDALYPRPPKEAQAQLQTLVSAGPTAELYRLRAHADEQALDFPAAEADWKLYAAQAQDAVEGKLQLAAYYARRLQTDPEIQALTAAAALPDPPEQVYADPYQQRSWRTFTLLIATLSRQGAPVGQTVAAFDAFVARYPAQPAVYARYLDFVLNGSANTAPDYAAAQGLIARYQQQFPQDIVFPIRAQAQLEARRGNPDQALAVYDKAFQPLWPADLMQSYFALLKQTHRERAFGAAARVQLAAHPDGPEALNAVARLFAYDAQAGRLAQAQQTLDTFRVEREARHGAWTALDLYTLAQLSAGISNDAEAARYDYALASTPGNLPSDTVHGEAAAQAGLAALTHLLLSAPDQPLALGTGNLSLYRDIATLDAGPGYWNGILSLWLNGTSPASEYDSENTKAQSYFHRAKAAELLAELDQKFPGATERAALHAELIGAEAQYGEPAALIADSTHFLVDYPTATQRLTVGGLLADAYARQGNTAAEFALYDRELAELASQSKGMPLTAAEGKPAGDATSATTPGPLDLEVQYPPVRVSLAPATQYRALLDRYLGRLVALKQLPQALTLLRRELDRSPNDPQLYERLATFLQQNDLTAQQEQVFQAAIQKFGTTGWYDRLARLYLKEQKRQAFATLTRKVTDIFAGSDLDAYFSTVSASGDKTAAGPQLALQLNLYAAKRFPHDLVFTRNLLTAYQAKPTANAQAYEALLRRQWFAADDLRDDFMQFLTRTGKLDAELAQLQPADGSAGTKVGSVEQQPAAAQELAELHIWTSHFEAAGSLFSALSEVYPASPELNDRAVSLFRSFSYLDPTRHSLERAVSIEQKLLTAAPDSPDRLATLGDLYAEATAFEGAGEDLIAAAPYWQRIPALHPGTPTGYLTTATIFWDYFQYDDALAALRTARTRFNAPALYGYEAGAIEENRRDMAAAIDEYTRAAARPVTLDSRVQLAWAALDALFSAPSDEADSNLQSTVSAFFGTEQAHDRLVQLASREATKTQVDQATAREVAAYPADIHALTLRADVLTAQSRTDDLAPLLTAAIGKAQTLDEASAIGALAQTHRLTPVYETALERQITLSADPVSRIELQYQLAQSLETRRETAAAQKVYEQVYAADPRSLGVVRATTDFYARSGQQPRAIATLLQAAKVATPQLAHDFTLEAATRANDSGNPAQARALALTLLPQSPYDAAVLGVIATSYARANDNAGLKTFYLAELDQAAKDPAVQPAARKAEIALLRRGLIPALTRLGDNVGATDQYIALISAFPDDTGTANEAALYALRYKRQAQLLGFLQMTVKQSPQDSRYAVLLAQTQTTYGDLPAALTAYDAAINVRKDRADLYEARVALELLLAPSDPALLERAAADDERIYILTYHDPQWQTRIAELRARQNRPADAVKALQVASPLEGAKAADNALSIAAKLADWNFSREAGSFANQGAQLSGTHLLTEPGSRRAAIYARVLTREGRAATALRTLVAAGRTELAAMPGDHDLELYADSSADPADGTDTSADSEADNSTDSTADASADTTTDQPAEDAAAIRKRLLAARRRVIQANLKSAVRAMGATVSTYATPENKAAYAGLLDQLHASDAPLAIEAAAGAGFADREAAWRKQALLTGAPDPTALAAYVALEQSRLQFKELAQTLEACAVHARPDDRAGVRQQAAAAYRDAGDAADELRLTRTLALGSDGALRDRYFDLLLNGNAAALNVLAASADQTLADAAVNYTVAHGTEQQALATEATRARSLPAVWRPAAQSLTSLFFAGIDRAPAQTANTTANFQQALATEMTIGQRAGHASDPAVQLVGDVYFPYASGYGIFLALTPATRAQAEDFLPAPLEAAPSDPQAYLEVARSYAEANDVPGAQAQYAHVLELQASGELAVRAHDEQAVLLFRAGRREQALAEWHAAFAAVHDEQVQSGYTQSFYTDVALLSQHVAAHHLDFRADFTAILRPYFAQNANYRSNELLKAAYEAGPTPAQGAALITSLADAASDPDLILTDLNNVTWLPQSSRLALLERRVDLAHNRSGPSAESNLLEKQQTLLLAYLQAGEYARAEALLPTLRPPAVTAASPTASRNATLDRVRLRLAARAGRLPALLESYLTAPDTQPELPTLAEVAATLAANDPPDASDSALLREFIFEQKQSSHTLLPIDFLALAQARLAVNDVPGAVDVLRRLTLEPGAADDPDADPYANTDSAAMLLESTHHVADAVPLLQRLTQAVPWNAGYKLRLGQAQLAAGQQAGAAGLLAVAQEAQAPYAVRVQAARALAQAKTPAAPSLGSAELNLLAMSSPNAAQAEQPFFNAAQLALGEDPQTAPADRVTLLRRYIATNPNGLTADGARLQLFLAEGDAGTQPADMLAQLRMVNVTSPPATSVDTDPDTEAADPADAEADSAPAPAEPVASDASGSKAVLPPAAATLQVATRVRLAQLIAQVNARAGQMVQAVSFQQLAVDLDLAIPGHRDHPDAGLAHQLAMLQAAVQLESRNAVRRPVFHAALDQKTAVRPRLTAADLLKEAAE